MKDDRDAEDAIRALDRCVFYECLEVLYVMMTLQLTSAMHADGNLDTGVAD